MKLLDFKKGQEVMSNWPFWILYAIAVSITLLILVNMGKSIISASAEIPLDLEDKTILIPRLYNSGNCLAYIDDNGKVNTKLIDFAKFRQENIERCFIGNTRYAFSVSLYIPELNLNTREISTPNWIGGVATKRIKENVFVIYNGIEYKSELTISIENA